MKQTMRDSLMLYSYYDRAGIARHMERRAAQGWLLDELGTWSCRYRRTEPKQLRFAVTYFPAASQFDPQPSQQQESFWDLCAAAGWRLAASSAQMQVFYSEDPDPIPLETDPAVELDTLHRALKRSFLGPYWLLLVLSLMQLALLVWQVVQSPIDVLSDAVRLVSEGSFLPLLLLTGAELARYGRWRRRARQAVEAGGPLPELRSTRTLTLAVLGLVGLELVLTLAVYSASRGMLLLLLGCFLSFGLVFLLIHGARQLLKRRNAPKAVNLAVTIVLALVLYFALMAGLTAFTLKQGSGWLTGRSPAETYEAHGMTWQVHHDPIPLRVEDLTGLVSEDWSTTADVSRSPLLTHREYEQRARLDAAEDLPDLSYEIVEIHVPALYDLCRQDLLTKYWYNTLEEYRDNYLPIDPALWGAEEAYQLHSYDGTPSHYYLLCWEDRLAEVHFWWDPTPAQMALAGEVLKTA